MAGVDLEQAPTLLPKKFDQRLGLRLVSRQPFPNHRLLVVFPDYQVFAIQIAHPRHPRRMGTDVIEGTAAGTLPPSVQSGNNYIVIDYEVNHHLANPPAVEPAAKMLGLRPGARIAVQNKSIPCVRLFQTFFDQSVDYFVADQSPRMHGGGYSGTQGFTLPNVLAQHVARRYMRHLQAILKQIGLRAFSRTWGPEQNRSRLHGSCFCRYKVLRRPRILPARGVKPS